MVSVPGILTVCHWRLPSLFLKACELLARVTLSIWVTERSHVDASLDPSMAVSSTILSLLMKYPLEHSVIRGILMHKNRYAHKTIVLHLRPSIMKEVSCILNVLDSSQ